MDWLTALIGPDDGTATTWQFCVRALVLLPYGILCIRIAGRRTFSNLTPLDIFVAIVVGSNISRAMTGKAPFLPTLAATRLVDARVEKRVRGWEKTSDHAPVWIELANP